jgi:hypothetical protein
MIITSHMQKIIQIDPCLLKLSRKQDTILKIGDFSTTNYDFLPKPLLQIFPCNNPSKIMIITSHMQNIIQIYPCLLKLKIKMCKLFIFHNFVGINTLTVYRGILRLYEQHDGFLIRRNWVHSRFLWWVRVALRFIFLCCIVLLLFC